MEATVLFNDGKPDRHYDDVTKVNCVGHREFVKITHRDGFDLIPKSRILRISSEKEGSD